MQSQKKTMTSFLNTGEQGHCQIFYASSKSIFKQTKIKSLNFHLGYFSFSY